MGSYESAPAPSTDYSYLGDMMNEVALNVLVNSTAAASTLQAWDNMFVDIFSDADGTDDTIDEANTTAIFDTDLYGNGKAGSVTDAHELVITLVADHSARWGYKFRTNVACTLTTATKHASDNSTTCELADSSKTPIAEVSFVGDVATFTAVLEKNTDYYISAYHAGANRDIYRKDGADFPVNKTNVNFTQGYSTDSGGSIVSVATTTPPKNSIIQTNAITITTGVQTHQVYCHNALVGTGAIDYDISFDNGSTWITGQALGQSNSDNHAGTQMILKLNLNGVGAGNTAKADDYAILLTY